MTQMNQPVSSIMSSDLVIITPEDKVGEAFAKMRENGIHHLIVTTDGKLAGVLSANDVLDMSTRRDDWAELQVQEAMTTRLAKMNPKDPIGAAAKIFTDYWFHSLPIVTVDSEVVGIVTLLDVTRYMYRVLYED